MDPISVTALIISIVTVIGQIVLHIKHCESGCLKCDCFKPNNDNDSMNNLYTDII